MKASKLLKHIQSLIDTHGDLDCAIIHGADGSSQSLDPPRVYDADDIEPDGDIEDDESPRTKQLLCFYWNS